MRISRRLHVHALSSQRAKLHQNTEFDHVLSLFAALAHLAHHHHLGSLTTEQPGRFFFFFKGSLAKGTAPRSNSPHLRRPQSTAAHRRSNPLSSPVNDSFTAQPSLYHNDAADTSDINRNGRKSEYGLPRALRVPFKTMSPKSNYNRLVSRWKGRVSHKCSL